jgi:hypothetical protein
MPPDLKPGLLGRALILSILIHLTGFGAWKIAQRFHFLDNNNLLALLHRLERKTSKAPLKPAQPAAPAQVPVELLFNIDADNPFPVAPEKPKFYGPQNALAANPTEAKETEQPIIDGRQNKVIRTASAAVSQPHPLQPSPPVDPGKDAEEKKARSQPKMDIGTIELARVKPDPLKTPEKDDKGTAPEPKHVRARTLAQLNRSHLGDTMKQEGGVRRVSLSALDTKGSIMGDYDSEFVDAVQSRWYTLLEDHPNLSAGHVVLQFVMHPDGGISEMKLITQTVGEDFLWETCKSAVLDPAPFKPWPPEMRREIGSDRREVRFTFYYD